MKSQACIQVVGTDVVLDQPDLATAIRLSLEMNVPYGMYLIEKKINHDPTMLIAWAVPTTYAVLGLPEPAQPEPVVPDGRGDCSHCGRRLSVRGDGRVRHHRSGVGARCPGSGRAPSDAPDAVRGRA